MVSYKSPDFRERAALSSEAKLKALERLRAKPPIDNTVVVERRAARLGREEMAAEKRRAKRAAEKESKRATRAATVRDADRDEIAPPALTDADRKAARDARYAARKGRK